jgi:putative DNA primase/helicase
MSASPRYAPDLFYAARLDVLRARRDSGDLDGITAAELREQLGADLPTWLGAAGYAAWLADSAPLAAAANDAGSAGVFVGRTKVRDAAYDPPPPDIQRIVEALEGESAGSGSWRCRCPAHKDDNPSLSVSVGKANGKLLVYCHGGCSQDAVIGELKRLGLWPDRKQHGEPTAIYDYRDENDTLVYQVCRYGSGEGKTFKQRRPDPDRPGQWIWKMAGTTPLPYRLPQLLAADSGAIALIPEGEKDCNALAKLGFTATCNHMGAGKWNPKISHWLRGFDVVLLPDNDESGRLHVEDVAEKLDGTAARIRILVLPGLPAKGDVSDWIGAGGTADELLRLAEAAPDWKPEPTDKPTIRVTADSLPDNATEGESALIKANIPIYCRRGDLVRPIVETVQASDDRRTNIAQLVPIDAVYLRDLLCRHAYWVKHDKRTKTWFGMNAPTDVAATILKRRGEWRLRPVTAIINTPTMRPDGSILSAPGYDPETRFILIDPPQIPHIDPTRANAEKALRLLDALLDEFPFADQKDDTAESRAASANRSVALSALITPIVRAAFPVAPLHAINAPVAGSGKSYLLDTVAANAIGDIMPVMTAGKTEEETEKRVGSALMVAQSLINIDNLTGPLGGDFLCQAVERQGIIYVRILGKSKIVPVEPRGTTFFATGNNLQITGDMPRRAIRCTLNPKVEHPETRTFRGDPVATVLGARGDYIAACFTIVRAYLEAGRPDLAPKLASFGGWSDTVRSALMWLGCADPVATMEAIRADDPERAMLDAVLRAWAAEIGTGYDGRCTAAKLLEMIGQYTFGGGALGGSSYRYPELRTAILVTGFKGKVDARGLGWWLRKHKEQIIDGRYLTKKSDAHGAEWYVETTTAPAVAACDRVPRSACWA